MKKSLIYLLLCPILNYGQIVVDSINIDTQFFGPFNKTRVEIALYNNSDIYYETNRFTFNINKSAFVKNVWLDINGEQVNVKDLIKPISKDHIKPKSNKDSKKSRRKRSRRMKYSFRKYCTGSNGNYYLNIPVFKKHQKKTIIIEYFSLLVNDGNENQIWKFKNLDLHVHKKTIRIRSYQPIGTKLFLDNSRTKNFYSGNTQTDSVLIIDTLLINPSSFNITFDYNNIKSVIAYSYNTIKYYLVVDSLKKYYQLDFKDKYPPNELLKIINDINSNKKTIVTTTIKNPKSFIYTENNYQFYRDILKYLAGLQRLTYTEFRQQNDIDIIHRFFSSDSSKLFIVDSINNTNLGKKPIEIECPYLSIFPLYLKDIKIQGMDTYEYQEEFEPVFFIAVEKMPEPIGGIDSIQAKLFYPNKILASIEGRAYVKAKVSSKGQVVKLNTIRGLHSVLDKIGRFALSNTLFIPARNKGKNISLDVTVPLGFSLDTTYSRIPLKITSPNYHIGDTVYNLKMVKGKLFLFDKNADLNKIKNIQFLSDEYFELIINHTELLDIIYKALYLSELDGLILKIDNKTIQIKKY